MCLSHWCCISAVPLHRVKHEVQSKDEKVLRVPQRMPKKRKRPQTHHQDNEEGDHAIDNENDEEFSNLFTSSLGPKQGLESAAPFAL